LPPATILAWTSIFVQFGCIRHTCFIAPATSAFNFYATICISLGIWAHPPPPARRQQFRLPLNSRKGFQFLFSYSMVSNLCCWATRYLWYLGFLLTIKILAWLFNFAGRTEKEKNSIIHSHVSHGQVGNKNKKARVQFLCAHNYVHDYHLCGNCKIRCDSSEILSK
jgi:hypothetical protein